MVNFDPTDRQLSAIDVSEILSIYMLLDLKMERGDEPEIFVDRVMEIVSGQDKQVEDITLGVAELQRGPTHELQIMFVGKEAEIEVLENIQNRIALSNEVDQILESIATSHLNETKDRVRDRYDYVM